MEENQPVFRDSELEKTDQGSGLSSFHKAQLIHMPPCLHNAFFNYSKSTKDLSRHWGEQVSEDHLNLGMNNSCSAIALEQSLHPSESQSLHPSNEVIIPTTKAIQSLKQANHEESHSWFIIVLLQPPSASKASLDPPLAIIYFHIQFCLQT
jgi:hypothetical protein